MECWHAMDNKSREAEFLIEKQIDSGNVGASKDAGTAKDRSLLFVLLWIRLRVACFVNVRFRNGNNV